MHIVCASYQNIGPFENQIITTFLKPGKYLIKAPIGSGKSFLFFDGLVYALYGYAKRDMLNVNCKSGRTKVLFTNDEGELYFIERPLSGKKGVRLCKVNSEFGILNARLEKEFNEVLTYGKDFSDFLDVANLESVDFHRVAEVQQSIELLLPPKNVFLNRHILMQDSDNIFELQPRARIDVLKLMFGLDMIDTIKEKIADKKSELKGELKVLTESLHLDEQYKRRFESMKLNNAKIQSLLEKLTGEEKTLQRTYDDIGFKKFLENPLCEHLDALDSDVLQWTGVELNSLCTSYSNKHLQLQANLSSLTEQLQSKQALLQEKSLAITQLQDFIGKLIKDNPGLLTNGGNEGSIHTKLEALLAQKAMLTKNIEESDAHIDKTNRSLLGSYDLVAQKENLKEYVHLLESLKQLGIAQKQECDLLATKLLVFQEKLQNIGKEVEAAQEQLSIIKKNEFERQVDAINHDISIIQNNLTDIQSSFQTIETQTKALDQTLVGLQTQEHSEEQLHCDLDHVHCTIVEVMKAESSDKLHKQCADIEKQKQALIKQAEILYEKEKAQQLLLMQKQNELGTMHIDGFVPSSAQYLAAFERYKQLMMGPNAPSLRLEAAQLEAEQKNAQQRLEKIRSDYKELFFPGLEDLVQTYHNIQDQLGLIDNQIFSIQQQFQQYQTKIQEYHRATAQLEQHNKEVSILESEIEWLSNQELILEKSVNNTLFAVVSQLSDYVKVIDILSEKAKDMYREKKRIESKALSTKLSLEMATNLHGIFSKELILYILQSYIPLLNEYINAFLSKVVDFELFISISQEADELLLAIRDSYGEREVRSLSGGQKTVLRLCWVLATSVVFKNSFLLLDETINNIDNQIISKIAELLTDYAKQHNITFYTVTHSEQIQQMNIRDEIIEIKSPYVI